MDVMNKIALALRARRIRRRGDPELSWLCTSGRFFATALDIGAHKGVYTYWLSKFAGDIHSFEPNPDLANLLALSVPKNVTVHNFALSDKDGGSFLNIPLKSDGLTPDEPSARVVDRMQDLFDTNFRIQTRALDNLRLANVDFIKIDVEGLEEKVIEGGWGLILRDRPMLIVELENRHNSGCPERVVRKLSCEGYDCGFIHRGDFLSTSELDLTQPIFAERRINNFVFIPSAG